MNHRLDTLITSPFDLEFRFTDVFKSYREAHPAILEAKCLEVLYPAILQSIGPMDQFAGKASYHAVGMGMEIAAGGAGYYCNGERLRFEAKRAKLDPETYSRVSEMIRFWENEATIDGKFDRNIPHDMRLPVENCIGRFGGRMAGITLDFDKLVRMGIPGLYLEIDRLNRISEKTGEDCDFFTGLRMALDVFVKVCHFYAADARKLASRMSSAKPRHAELLRMAGSLESITENPPRSFREAIQLTWLFTLLSGVVNYGRMDVYLGDLYVHDLDNKVIKPLDALKMLVSLWHLIGDREIFFNSRVVLGGRGRRNEKNADKFARLALEVTRRVFHTEPQLTLRFYDGQDPRLYEKSLRMLGNGRTYPLLYNDDVNIPAIAHVYGCSLKEAENYYPYGCGELVIEHATVASPNSSLNLLKALEVALFRGRDILNDKKIGLKYQRENPLLTWDALWEAYTQQVEYHVNIQAQLHALELDVESSECALLYASLLNDQCLERGRSILNGGSRYVGGMVETFGAINVGDSLYAIKHLVYDTAEISLEALLQALRDNFEGHTFLHNRLRQLPKYGNDHAGADAMTKAVFDHVSEACLKAGRAAGLDVFLAVNISNSINVFAGSECGASAEGRRSGQPLANGNTPTSGNDVEGFTAFLNSIRKIDHNKHGGVVHNMKLSQSLFQDSMDKVISMLDVYFKGGGSQAMITVVNKDDLERAMREPEKYQNIMVRIGGYSCRFTHLSRDIQQEVLDRTLYS